MATIWTNTKDGITSVLVARQAGQLVTACKCCLSECCLYPASAYQVTYDFQDLPERLIIPDAPRPDEVYNKVAAPYPQRPDREYLVFYEGNANPEPFEDRPNSFLFIPNGVEVPGNRDFDFGPAFSKWEPISFEDGRDCLVQALPGRPLDEVPPVYISPQDDFADTYLGTCGQGQNAVQKIYRRAGLCRWVSKDNEGNVTGYLYYRTNATKAEADRFGRGRVLWALSGVGFRSPQTGPYNSPEGKYGEAEECEVVAVE
jgi:hypothetical protein